MNLIIFSIYCSLVMFGLESIIACLRLLELFLVIILFSIVGIFINHCDGMKLIGLLFILSTRGLNTFLLGFVCLIFFIMGILLLDCLSLSNSTMELLIMIL